MKREEETVVKITLSRNWINVNFAIPRAMGPWAMHLGSLISVALITLM